MVIYSGFSHWKWWFSIVMLVYQRVTVLNDIKRCWMARTAKSSPLTMILWKWSNFVVIIKDPRVYYIDVRQGQETPIKQGHNQLCWTHLIFPNLISSKIFQEPISYYSTVFNGQRPQTVNSVRSAAYGGFPVRHVRWVLQTARFITASWWTLEPLKESLLGTTDVEQAIHLLQILTLTELWALYTCFLQSLHKFRLRHAGVNTSTLTVIDVLGVFTHHILVSCGVFMANSTLQHLELFCRYPC